MRAFDFDRDDEATFTGWFGAVDASTRFRWPGQPGWQRAELHALARSTPDATAVLSALAADDGTVVAAALTKIPEVENTDLVEVVELSVVPERRRQGLGTVLVAHLTELTRSLGRSRMLANSESRITPPESPPAEFAERCGFLKALASSKRRLVLPIGATLLEGLDRDARSHMGDGYEVRTWTGPCPEEFVADRLALAHGMWTDTPAGEIDRAPERWDATRLRSHEGLLVEMGRTVYAAGVVDRSSGALVGFTEIGVHNVSPKEGYQFDTIVLRGHRGHRLGMVLKVANLQAVMAASPSTTSLSTWNADDNAPMISVNDQLGYERVAQGAIWRRDLH